VRKPEKQQHMLAAERPYRHRSIEVIRQRQVSTNRCRGHGSGPAQDEHRHFFLRGRDYRHDELSRFFVVQRGMGLLYAPSVPITHHLKVVGG
jgi:hypothetical protein